MEIRIIPITEWTAEQLRYNVVCLNHQIVESARQENQARQQRLSQETRRKELQNELERRGL